MKKQAKQLEEQLGRMQEELEHLRVTGESSGQLVKVTMSGDKRIVDVAINPECIDPDDVEGLQDLIVEAAERAHEALAARGPSLPAGLDSLPFGL